MWEIKGVAENIEEEIIAVYKTNCSLREKLSLKYIYRCYASGKGVGLLYKKRLVSKGNECPSVWQLSPKFVDELHDGDVLKLCKNGHVQRLFDVTSKSNVLFVTEECNSHCIMCPQPQRAVEHTAEVLKILELIPQNQLRNICISGGEPTVCPRLKDVLVKLKQFPYVNPIMLTNGRCFTDFQFTKEIMQSAPKNMVYAIPLYSAVAHVHDYIVGAHGAFKESVLGIYNLTRFRAPIEIRVVITRQNYLQLDEIANFIGWNLPMVIHVAFMGMETVGRAAVNSGTVWIEPVEYMEKLEKAVKMLAHRNMAVSVYNLPLCILPMGLQRYAVNSISDWKQGYIPQCESCSKRSECCGIFTTSKIVPKNLKPFKI